MRGVTKARSDLMKKADPRVQAIRCKSCHRLRAHPRIDDPKTYNCGCGSFQFFDTFPHPDEEQIALKLYARDIEEANLYSVLAQSLLNDWRAEQAYPQDMPKPKIIII